jgi:16S rRNA G966 N2-methylase RsmD
MFYYLIHAFQQYNRLCGDSTRKQSLDKLFSDEKPDLIFTDPPYGIDYIAIKDRGLS